MHHSVSKIFLNRNFCDIDLKLFQIFAVKILKNLKINDIIIIFQDCFNLKIAQPAQNLQNNVRRPVHNIDFYAVYFFHRDVHIIEVKSPPSVIVLDIVQRSKKLGTKHLVLVLKSGAPVEWVIHARGVKGDIEIIVSFESH